MTTSIFVRISKRTRGLVEEIGSSGKKIGQISSGKRVIRVEMCYSTQS